MDKTSFFNVTKKLSDVGGVVGDEDNAAILLSRILKDYVDDIYFDKFGNLIGVKHGKENSPKIMLEAHIDEIGLVVDYIDEGGFIFFRHLGVWEPRILPAQRMRIKTRRNGEIHGIVGMKPLHIEINANEDNHAWGMRELFIDLGARNIQEVKNIGIRKGDPIFFDRELIAFETNPDIITGKALDNRLGCACMVDVLDQLGADYRDATVYVVATMQGELALNGAYNLLRENINPDFVIVFDTTVAGDVPGVNPKDSVSRIGEGTLIKVAEYGEWPHGHVVNKNFVDYLISIAEENKIAYQLEVLEEATTTATAIQLALGGIIAGTLSVPSRYLHCPIELADLNDAMATSTLACLAIKNMTKKKLEEFYKKVEIEGAYD